LTATFENETKTTNCIQATPNFFQHNPTNLTASINMPPKNKKKGEDDDLGLMKAARFGRVKNTLSSELP
jgi:hypothetical protein